MEKKMMENKKIWSGLPVVIFGSGGISKESYFLLEEINRANNTKIFNFLGFIDKNVGEEVINSYKVICWDSDFKDYIRDFPVIGAIIPQGEPNLKSKIVAKLGNIPNVVYPNLIHPNVTLEIDSVCLGMGNIITSGVNMTCDINLGDFNLINLNCTVGHDVKISNYNVINPGVTISGNVDIGNNCLLGTGANVLQGIKINNNATVGAGAVVVKDVEAGVTVVGVPAKCISK